MTAALLATALTACGGPEERAATGHPERPPGWPAELVLGVVPSREANVLIDTAADLSDFLSRHLGLPVESFVPQDYTGLLEAMGSGRADIGLIPPFAAMLGRQRFGLETLLISVRDGSPTYRAQWMTRDPSLCQSSPERNPEGLLECRAPIQVVEGRRVGFTDPTSTSGYLYPSLQLLEAGIDPEEDVQGVFLGSHDAAVIGLYNGDVEISVSFEDARRLVRDEIPDIGDLVLVFNHSEPIPNDGVTVRGDLPEDLKLAIEEAFLAFSDIDAERPKEERVLWRMYEIEGFVEFQPGTYEVVERAFARLRDNIRI